MRSSLKRLWKHESGQDAAEYALLIVGIVIVVVGAIYAFGNSQSHTFSGAAQTVIGGSSSGAGGGWVAAARAAEIRAVPAAVVAAKVAAVQAVAQAPAVPVAAAAVVAPAEVAAAVVAAAPAAVQAEPAAIPKILPNLQVATSKFLFVFCYSPSNFSFRFPRSTSLAVPIRPATFDCQLLLRMYRNICTR